MTQKERADRVSKSLQLIVEAEKLLGDIVWKGQEGQSDHFDKLSKLEKVMLCSSHHSVKLAFTSLEGLYNAYKYNTFPEET